MVKHFLILSLKSNNSILSTSPIILLSLFLFLLPSKARTKNMFRSLLHKSPPLISLLLIPATLLAITFLVVYPNEFRLQSALFSPCGTGNGRPAPSKFIGSLSPAPEFSLLMGVFTRAETFQRRHLVRLVNAHWQGRLPARVDVRFIMCNVTSEEHAAMVALEILRYGDIIVLNCTENLNSGKILTYFTSLPVLFADEPYDYVMKADDDAFFRLDNLINALRHKPRKDLYYGLEIPCRHKDVEEDGKFPMFPAPFMTGLGYALSWDVVEWMAASEIPREHSEGPEDMMVGWWLSMGERGKNRYDAAPAMYDFRWPNQSTYCIRHDFIPDTVAVHRLKTNVEWAATLKYFNLTAGLKPSKLYHLP